MKKIFSSISVLLVSFTFITFQSHQTAWASQPATHDLAPVLMTIMPHAIFNPLGFDSNDNAQVVIDGILPSTCHKVGPVYKRIDREKKQIVLHNYSYFYSGSWCAEVIIPYQLTINLGPLPDGQFTVLVEDEDNKLTQVSRLPIKASITSNPDDYLYAPVEESHFDEKSKVLVLWGTFTNSCMKLKNIKVHKYPNKHVLEVLPIASIEKGECSTGLYPFTANVRLKNGISGRTLVHVRALNGKALNQVVNL